MKYINMKEELFQHTLHVQSSDKKETKINDIFLKSINTHDHGIDRNIQVEKYVY